MTISFARKIGLSAVCVVALIGLTFLAGCSPSGPQRYDVSGKVSCDGKPIKQGSILFEPLDKSLGTEGGTINDGQFKGTAKEGKNKVRITGLDIGPNTRYIEGAPLASNFLPPKFNDETELEIDVTSQNRTFDFDLTSK